MSVLFGEIVEPSTRALIDEDLEEYPDYVKISPEWEGSSEAPKEVNSLIFLESKIVKDLVHRCVLLQQKSICRLKNGIVEIFVQPNNNYLVLYNEEKQLNPAQIVEALEEWICTAKTIYTITSDSIHNYQNPYLVERPVSLIRIVTNSENNHDYKKLEHPNLVTGLGSTVLTFCIHQALKKCTLFVVYMDKSPVDSYNTGALLEIFKKLGLPIKSREFKMNASSSNLYM